MKNILVVGHERSGHHFLMNTIMLNWNRYDSENWHDFPIRHNTIFEFIKNVPLNRDKIYKTHHQWYNFQDCFDELLEKFHVFYVIRDGRDVMVSAYYHFKFQNMFYEIGKKTFSEFIRLDPKDMKIRLYSMIEPENMVLRWVEHVNSWIDKGIEVIKFEDMKNNWNDVVVKVEQLLGKSDTKIKPTLDNICVNPRKGIVGDWKNHFNKEDLNYFNKYASETMNKLEYYK